MLEMKGSILFELMKFLFVRSVAYVNKIIIVKLLQRKYSRYFLIFALKVKKITLLKVNLVTSHNREAVQNTVEKLLPVSFFCYFHIDQTILDKYNSFAVTCCE